MSAWMQTFERRLAYGAVEGLAQRAVDTPDAPEAAWSRLSW